MHFDVAVFDFDDTLVQSADAKRKAFFDIFPRECALVIEAVLHAHPEESRYIVIPRIVAQARRELIPLHSDSVEQLVASYADQAAAAVNQSPEMPGAANVIRRFAEHMPVYVSSTTPVDQLENLLANRAWNKHLSGVFGYPDQKAETVAMLLKRHAVAPSRLLVIGDGDSDCAAAKQSGCAFFRIAHPVGLQDALAFAGFSNA